MFPQEQGFKELTEALERHRKGTPLKTVHYYPPQQDTSPSSSTRPDPQNETDEGNQTDYTDDSHYPSSFASSRFGSSSSIPYTPPTHEVPDNYIADDEDAGLPGTKDLRNYSRKKARYFVRTHLRKPTLWRSHEHKGKDSSASRRRKETLPHVDREKDVENAAASQEVDGGGILSTLLNLYQRTDISGAITPTTTSNQSSRRSSFGGEDRAYSATNNESDRRRSAREKPPWSKAGKHLLCKAEKMLNYFCSEQNI